MRQVFLKSLTEGLYMLATIVAFVLSMLVFWFGEPFYSGMPVIFFCGTYMFLSRYWNIRRSKKEAAWVLPLGIFYFFLAVVTGLLCIVSCITNW